MLELRIGITSKKSVVIRRKLGQKRQNRADFVVFEIALFLHEYESTINVLGIQKYLQDLIEVLESIVGVCGTIIFTDGGRKINFHYKKCRKYGCWRQKRQNRADFVAFEIEYSYTNMRPKTMV